MINITGWADQFKICIVIQNLSNTVKMLARRKDTLFNKMLLLVNNPDIP